MGIAGEDLKNIRKPKECFVVTGHHACHGKKGTSKQGEKGMFRQSRTGQGKKAQRSP